MPARGRGGQPGKEQKSSGSVPPFLAGCFAIDKPGGKGSSEKKRSGSHRLVGNVVEG